MNLKIRKYIEDCRKSGYSDEKIKLALEKAGFDKKVIEDYIKAMDSMPEPKAEPEIKEEVPKEKTNFLAIMSIIFGIVAPLVGIFLGIAALKHIRNSGEKGRGLAIAGLIISIILLIAEIAVITLMFVVPYVNDLNKGYTSTVSDVKLDSIQSCPVEVGVRVLGDKACLTDTLTGDTFATHLVNTGSMDINEFTLYADGAPVSSVPESLNLTSLLMLKTHFNAGNRFSNLTLIPKVTWNGEEILCNTNLLDWNSADLVSCDSVEWDD